MGHPKILSAAAAPAARLAAAGVPRYGPRPAWDRDRYDREGHEYAEKMFAAEREWKSHVRRGLSLGHLTGEQAKALGFHGDGHDTDRNGDLAWKPLPQEMYHVTTALPQARQGLKTRQELGQHMKGGHGLGGGADDTISLTTSHPMARDILRSLHEFHAVVNGDLTPQQMWDRAKRGDQGTRPYHEDIAHQFRSGWHEGDPLPTGLEGALTGHEVRMGGMLDTREEIERRHGPGWEPIEEMGHHDAPRGRMYYAWRRKLDPDRAREQAAGFYKNFAFNRAQAGGPEDPLFVSTDTKAFAAKDPGDFAILHVRPREGAQGYQVGSMDEWRTGSGDALEAHRAQRLEGGQLHEARARRWYHGTRYELHPGDALEGGRFPSNQGYGQPGDHVYYSGKPSIAAFFAQAASGPEEDDWEGTPRVYQVEPDETHERDPDEEEHADSWRARNACVLREVPWQPHWGHQDGPADTIPAAEASRQWQPSSGVFGPTTGLDHRLFGEDGELRPEVRAAVMERLDQCLRASSGLAGSDWQQWLRVYLAGGSASEWAGGRPNEGAQDLDVLIGTDYESARSHSPALSAMSDDQIDSALNAAFRSCFNAQGATLPGVGGTWDLTAYANPRAWDITAIRPYAAYDVTGMRWAVRPPHLPGHSAADFDPAILAQARAVAAEARAILRMPEPLRTREATALWERIHAERSMAFSPQGQGWQDPGNLAEKWLAYAPRDLLGRIRELALAKTAAADGGEDFYHGTTAVLRPGDEVEPRPTAWQDQATPRTFFTGSIERASVFGHLKAGQAPHPAVHVYSVRPSGEYEHDPVAGRGSFRSLSPLRVTGEVEPHPFLGEFCAQCAGGTARTAATGYSGAEGELRVRSRDDLGWGPGEWEAARREPWRMASRLAQEQVRLDHPRVTVAFPRAHEGGNAVVGHLLVHAGYPAGETAGAFVSPHPHPEERTSNPAWFDGAPGVTLHPGMWDYGTAGHEAAHHAHMRAAGIGRDEQRPDEETHGPEWGAHYAQALNAISAGAGSDFLALQRHYRDMIGDGLGQATAAEERRPEAEFRTLPLTDLIIPDSYQRENLASGRQSETPGPIHVFPRDDMPGYEISDGVHRVSDAIRAGRTHIEAEVEPYPDDEQYDPPFYDFTPHMRRQAVTAAWDFSGSENTGVYLRFGHWPANERSFSPAGGYHEEGVSAYDLDRHGNPAIDHGLDRGHPEHYDDCDVDEFGTCQYTDPEPPDNDPREEMQGRVGRAEKNRRQGSDKPHETAHLVRGEMSGVGYDGEPLLTGVRRVGDWIDHRHLFIPGSQPHRLARDPSDEDYEPPEEEPPGSRRTAARDGGVPIYHGARYPFRPGDLISPGHPSNYPGVTQDKKGTHVYATDDLDEAASFAEQAKTPHQGRVFEVEPTGRMLADREEVAGHDPEFGPAGNSWMSRHPLRVVREVHQSQLPPGYDLSAIPRRAWDGDETLRGPYGDWASHQRALPGRTSARADAADDYVTCGQGHRHWGTLGAAGLLIRHRGDDGQYRYLLQERSDNGWVDHPGTWSIPGGAIGHGEVPEEAAGREAAEEIRGLPGDLAHHHTFTDDHGGWAYHTVVTDSPSRFSPSVRDGRESAGHGWFTPAQVRELPLHPGFAASWEKVRKSGAVKRAAGGDAPTSGAGTLEMKANAPTPVEGPGGRSTGWAWDPAPQRRGRGHDSRPLWQRQDSAVMEYLLRRDQHEDETPGEFTERRRDAQRYGPGRKERDRDPRVLERYRDRALNGGPIGPDPYGPRYDPDTIDRDSPIDWGHDVSRREAASGYTGLTSRSGMIYLPVPENLIRKVPGGVDDHHVTIVYLGKDVSDEAFAEACRRAKEAAAQVPPLDGVMRGISTFPASDGKVPAWVPVHVPGITRLRELLEDLSASEHRDWQPHLTQAYLEEGEDVPEPHPARRLHFAELRVKRGDDDVGFPLGGAQEISAQAARGDLPTEETWRARRDRVDRFLENQKRETMPLRDKWGPSAPNYIAHGLIAEHDGPVSDEHWEHLPEESISLRQPIHTHQGHVYPETVRHYLRADDDPDYYDYREPEPGGSDPKVVRHEGQHYLLDGHHRFVKDRLMGHDSMLARVFDTANPDHKQSNCYDCHTSEVSGEDHDSDECQTCQRHGWHVWLLVGFLAMPVKFAEHPQRSCREPVTPDGLIDHFCSLEDLHPGPHCPKTLRAAITRREEWEAGHPGWEKLIPADDPFAGAEQHLKGQAQ